MYAIQLGAAQFDPADAGVYYFGVPVGNAPGATAETDINPARLAFAGTIEEFGVLMVRRGLAPDAVDLLVALDLMVNGVENLLGEIPFSGGAGPVTDSSEFVALGIAVPVSGTISLRATMPTWVTTNPTEVTIIGIVYLDDNAEAASEAAQDAAIADFEASGVLTPDEAEELRARFGLRGKAGSDVGSLLAAHGGSN